MTLALTVPERAQPAFRAMVEAAADNETPCSLAPELWWSILPGERLEAARHCLRCPILTECETYLAASDEPQGVWAARLPEDRSRRVPELQRRTPHHHREGLGA